MSGLYGRPTAAELVAVVADFSTTMCAPLLKAR